MKFVTMLLFVLVSTSVFAQENEPPAEVREDLQVKVHVAHGTSNLKIADTVVFLRAARPKGPFEPQDPKPDFEWSELTNEDGLAVFTVPKKVSESGLRLHALATYGGTSFRSTAEPLVNNLQLKVPVYEQGTDSAALKFDSIRTIAEVWEDYMVFTQYYVLINDSETVIDTTQVSGFDVERGMPIELPVKALGVQVSAAGEHTVVNSTVYWKGRIRPQERVPIQMRFSMAAKSRDFVYEQEVQYPVRNSEVVIPLQTQFQKLPRLNDVTLSVPGAKMLAGNGILDLRQDMEFVGAEGVELKPGESIRFKIGNLPFAKSIVPWFVLGLGLFFGALVIFFGRREYAIGQQNQSKKIAIESLKRERDAVLYDIASLERTRDQVSEDELESVDLALRARLAMILKKIRDLEQGASNAGSNAP